MPFYCRSLDSSVTFQQERLLCIFNSEIQQHQRRYISEQKGFIEQSVNSLMCWVWSAWITSGVSESAGRGIVMRPVMTVVKGFHDEQHRGGSKNNLRYANSCAVIHPVTHPSSRWIMFTILILFTYGQNFYEAFKTVITVTNCDSVSSNSRL